MGFDFDKALEELGRIVADFEEGKLSLEEGLVKFERGLEIAAQCQERLREVENRIKEIKVRFQQLRRENSGKDNSRMNEEFSAG